VCGAGLLPPQALSLPVPGASCIGRWGKASRTLGGSPGSKPQASGGIGGGPKIPS
jgi:hypothetical protein